MRFAPATLACFAAASLAMPAAAAVPRTATAFALQRPPVRVLAPESMRGTFAGAVSPGTPVSILVHLPGQHAAELDRFVTMLMSADNAIASDLTPEQFGRYFGADPQVYSRAIATLRAGGFVIDDLPANRTDIVAHAAASRVEAFFATPLDQRVENGRVFFTARYQPLVPAGLGTTVISGLENYGRHHPLGLRHSLRPHITGSWTPQDLGGVYNLDPLYAKNLNGSGVTIANSTSGAALASDLSAFEQFFGLPQTPLISTGVGGQLSPACGRDCDNGESSLDVDSATSIARNATFHQVVAHTPSNHDFNLSYEYIVNDLGATVHIVTTSWGVCEHDLQGTPSLTIDNALLEQAVAEGQFWFSASGDYGTDDCDQRSVDTVSVDYPGTSPYVVSVGGTNVQGAAGSGGTVTWTGETAWQYSNSDGAGGGGMSMLFAKPSYQRRLTPHDGRRDVPDVALIADNDNSPIYAEQNGILSDSWGGTSEASPMWAGFLAIVEQSKGKAKLQNPHARLYALAATSRYATYFHDITSGNNGVPLGDDPGFPQRSFPGYNAGKGYDLATGLGSFNAAELLPAY